VLPIKQDQVFFAFCVIYGEVVHRGVRDEDRDAQLGLQNQFQRLETRVEHFGVHKLFEHLEFKLFALCA
jgi:hypothetical protein